MRTKGIGPNNLGMSKSSLANMTPSPAQKGRRRRRRGSGRGEASPEYVAQREVKLAQNQAFQDQTKADNLLRSAELAGGRTGKVGDVKSFKRANQNKDKKYTEGNTATDQAVISRANLNAVYNKQGTPSSERTVKDFSESDEPTQLSRVKNPLQKRRGY